MPPNEWQDKNLDLSFFSSPKLPRRYQAPSVITWLSAGLPRGSSLAGEEWSSVSFLLDSLISWIHDNCFRAWTGMCLHLRSQCFEELGVEPVLEEGLGPWAWMQNTRAGKGRANVSPSLWYLFLPPNLPFSKPNLLVCFSKGKTLAAGCSWVKLSEYLPSCYQDGWGCDQKRNSWHCHEQHSSLLNYRDT